MSTSRFRDLLSIRPKPSSYRYDPLNYSRNEIRLLHFVTPDISTDRMRRWSTSTVASKISLQISNVPLAQSEAFSALSYAWGTSEQDQEIALNGSSLSISQTLLDALVQLESEEDSKKKLFWIDAICINQYDYEEKSEQVQIMGDIYRQAADVIIWLGKEDPSSTFAFTSLKAMYDAQVFTRNELQAATAAIRVSGTRNYEQQNTFTNVKSKLDNYLSDCDFDSVAEAIDALTNRPWWRRLWILQELVLSRQAFLRCGPLAITWDSFEYFLDISDLFVACNLTHETATIVRLIRQETRILSRCWRKGKKGQKLSLFNLLVNIMAFGVRETSDPRDRVYALLGLAKDIEQLGIRPDYSLFREQVYMNTAEALISKEGLILLSYASSRSHAAGLPSWTPDFSKSATKPLQGQNPKLRPRASGYTDKVARFSSRGPRRLLEVTCLVIGTVTQKSDECPFPNDPFDSSKPKVLREWLQEMPWFSEDDEQLHSVLCKTLVANRISKKGLVTSRKAQPQDEAGFKALISRDESLLTSKNDTVNDYFYSAWNRTERRCLFVSSGGHIGLARSDIMVGDSIVIIWGADAPFVVREAGNDSYRLIEEAYVHGVMQGEALHDKEAVLRARQMFIE